MVDVHVRVGLPAAMTKSMKPSKATLLLRAVVAPEGAVRLRGVGWVPDAEQVFQPVLLRERVALDVEEQVAGFGSGARTTAVRLDRQELERGHRPAARRVLQASLLVQPASVASARSGTSGSGCSRVASAVMVRCRRRAGGAPGPCAARRPGSGDPRPAPAVAGRLPAAYLAVPHRLRRLRAAGTPARRRRWRRGSALHAAVVGEVVVEAMALDVVAAAAQRHVHLDGHLALDGGHQVRVDASAAGRRP